jgi:hypothetical protein
MRNLHREPELKPSHKPNLRGEDAQKKLILDSSVRKAFVPIGQMRTDADLA